MKNYIKIIIKMNFSLFFKKVLLLLPLDRVLEFE